MSLAQPIGQARIRIRPDFGPFRDEVKAEATSAAKDASTDVKVGADTGQAKVKLDELRADLDRFRSRTAEARVRLDGDTRAQQQIDRLDLSLRRLGLVTARPNVSVEGVERARIQLDGLAARLAAIDAMGGGAGGGGRRLAGGDGSGGWLSRFANADIASPSGKMLGLGLAGPLAVPLTGALLGGAASFLTPTIAGGIGLGAFGLGAKSSIQQVSKDVQQLTKLTGQYNAATTDKQRAAVLAKEEALWKSLDPAQRRAVKNVQGLEASWARYKKALEPQSFKVLADGAKIASTGLSLLLPVAQAVGGAVDGLEKQAEHALTQPFWKDFFGTFLTHEAPLAVTALGQTLGNLGTGFAHLTEAFAPLGHDLEQGMVRLSGRFEAWAAGQGPGKFVAWVEKEGPIVARTLQGLGSALVGIGKGLGPIGQVELKALTPVLEFLGKLGDEHPAVITAVGAALLTVGAGLKAINLAQGAAGVLGKIRGLGGGGGILGDVGKVAGATPVFVTNWPPNFGPGTPNVPGAPVPGGEKPPTGEVPEVPSGRVTRTLGRVGKIVREVGPAVVGVVVAGGGITNMVTHAGPGAANKAAAVAAGSYGFGAEPGELNPGYHGTAVIAKNPQQLDQYLADKNIEGSVAAKGAGVANAAKTDAKMAKLIADYQTWVARLESYRQKLVGAMAGKSESQQRDIQSVIDNVDQELSRAVQSGLLNAGAGGTSIGTTLSTAVDKAIVTKLKATVGGHLKSNLYQIAKNAAQDATVGGQSIGTDLGLGIVAGMQAMVGTVKASAADLIHKAALPGMRHAAATASPSKKTMVIGKDMADGLIIGFTGGNINAKFSAAIQGALQAGANAVAQFQSDVQARTQLQQSVAQNLLGVGDLSNVGFSNTGNVGLRSSNTNLISQLQQENRDMALLRKKGLDPDYLQQLGALPPDRAIFIAGDILSGSEGPISSLNRQRRQLRALAGSIGSTVANATYAPTLARDQRKIESLLTDLLTKKLDLSPHAEQMLERVFEQALRKAMPALNLSELDRSLGIKIRSHR